MKHSYPICLLIAITIFSIASCTATEQSRTALTDPVLVGWIGPLTGNVASVGIPNKEGVELAVADINKNGGINGQRLSVLYEDDSYDVKKTITAYTKLVNHDGIKVILSPSYAGILSLASQAETDGTIIVDSMDSSDELAKAGENIFAIGVFDEEIGLTAGRFLPASHNVSIIQNDADPFMNLIKESFIKGFKGKITSIQLYDSSTMNTKTLLLKAREGGTTTLAIFGFDEAGIIVREAREIGMNHTIIGIDTFATDTFRANAKGAQEGVYLTNWELPESASAIAFRNAYQTMFKKPLTKPLYAATGYDATMAIASALASGAEPKEALYNLKGYQGITGTITMDPDGVVRTIQERMYQYKNGAIVPAERSP